MLEEGGEEDGKRPGEGSEDEPRGDAPERAPLPGRRDEGFEPGGADEGHGPTLGPAPREGQGARRRGGNGGARGCASAGGRGGAGGGARSEDEVCRRVCVGEHAAVLDVDPELRRRVVVDGGGPAGTAVDAVADAALDGIAAALVIQAAAAYSLAVDNSGPGDGRLEVRKAAAFGVAVRS